MDYRMDRRRKVVRRDVEGVEALIMALDAELFDHVDKANFHQGF
jgi:hypothetical protein